MTNRIWRFNRHQITYTIFILCVFCQSWAVILPIIFWRTTSLSLSNDCLLGVDFFFIFLDMKFWYYCFSFGFTLIKISSILFFYYYYLSHCDLMSYNLNMTLCFLIPKFDIWSSQSMLEHYLLTNSSMIIIIIVFFFFFLWWMLLANHLSFSFLKNIISLNYIDDFLCIYDVIA